MAGPSKMLGLTGVGGTIHVPATSCAFLLDAAEHVDESSGFIVPFSYAALEVFHAYASCFSEVRLRLRSACHFWPAPHAR